MTKEHYSAATGRRKNSVGRGRLHPGKGDILINDKPMEELFVRLGHQKTIRRPLEVTETMDKFRVQVKVAGGGVSGWAGAVAHGIARALVVADENARRPLRRQGLLTRDARVKERKKYGLKRARKAPQYTKR